MPYFAVDDQAHGHRKFVKLGADRMAATGLWTTAGSWAAGHLTDGFVPDYVIEQWDPGLDLSKRLAAVGLWDADSHDGDTGFRFHEWADRNGTREKIEAKRADDAERKRRSRERQTRNGDGTYGPHDDGPGGGTLFDPPDDPATSDRIPEGVTPDVTRDVTRDSGGSPVGVGEESHRSQPNPTQPTPTHPPTDKDTPDAPRRGRARRGPIAYSAEFEEWWAAYHPQRREAKGDAARAFTKACRGAPLREGESRATTLTARVRVWVTHWQSTGMDPRFVPYPATWLNGNRYDDPPPQAPGAGLATTTGAVAPSGRVATTTQRIADIDALGKELFG